MNKRGQAQSIIIFFAVVVGILLTSIIVLRLVNTIITPFSAQIGNVSAPVGEAVDYAHSRFTSVWDWVIVLAILLNTILLFVSAFLVDIHPAFLLIYIIAVFFLIIFGNSLLYALDNIWDKFGTSTETAQTPLTQFIINNFQLFVLGIIVLSGILMYAKFKFFSGQGTGGNY